RAPRSGCERPLSARAPRRIAPLGAGPHHLVRRLCHFGARAGRRCCRSLARPAVAGGGDRGRGGDAGGAAAAATAPGPLCQWTRRAFGVRRRISLAHCRPRRTAIGLRLVGTMPDGSCAAPFARDHRRVHPVPAQDALPGHWPCEEGARRAPAGKVGEGFAEGLLTHSGGRVGKRRADGCAGSSKLAAPLPTRWMCTGAWAKSRERCATTLRRRFCPPYAAGTFGSFVMRKQPSRRDI